VSLPGRSCDDRWDEAGRSAASLPAETSRRLFEAVGFGHRPLGPHAPGYSLGGPAAGHPPSRTASPGAPRLAQRQVRTWLRPTGRWDLLGLPHWCYSFDSCHSCSLRFPPAMKNSAQQTRPLGRMHKLNGHSRLPEERTLRNPCESVRIRANSCGFVRFRAGPCDLGALSCGRTGEASRFRARPRALPGGRRISCGCAAGPGGPTVWRRPTGPPGTVGRPRPACPACRRSIRRCRWHPGGAGAGRRTGTPPAGRSARRRGSCNE